MCRSCNHAQLIAKIQYFSDKLKQIALEKESLVIVGGNKKEIDEVKKEIFVYQEISNDYDAIFKNIICD